jgi:hypothetical protein
MHTALIDKMYIQNYVISTTLVKFLAELAGRLQYQQMYSLWGLILMDVKAKGFEVIFNTFLFIT